MTNGPVQSYHFDIQRLIDSFLCPFLSSVQIKVSLVDTSKLSQIRWRYKLTYLKNDETIKKADLKTLLGLGTDMLTLRHTWPRFHAAFCSCRGRDHLLQAADGDQ